MKRIFRKPLAFLAAMAMGVPMVWAVGNNLYVGALADEVLGFDGLPLADGSCIEFRAKYEASASNWIAYPPSSSNLKTRNPLLATVRVGAGIVPPARGRGKFAACVSGLAQSKSYFVRLFNAPTPAESVAYCDSYSFTYDADDTHTVTNVLFKPWNSMDGKELVDTDGDGLVDLAETKIASTDPANPDSDGDGFLDGFEHTHGMDPNKKYELYIELATTRVPESLLEAGAPPMYLYDVTWSSVSGLTYNLEYTDALLGSKDGWTFVTNVTATNGGTMSVGLDDFHDYPIGFFRIGTLIPTEGASAGE